MNFRNRPILACAAALASLVMMGRAAVAADPGVAVLLVDTDYVAGQIDERIYGQFLEHINHSVTDGLYAEQIRGTGFEANDLRNFWEVIGAPASAEAVALKWEKSEKSIRLTPTGGTSGLRQKRLHVQAGKTYDGSVWIKPEQGTLAFALQLTDAAGKQLARVTLPVNGAEWQQVPFKFDCPATDTQAVIEITATGNGAALLDFVSLMRADARASGKLRPDLLDSLKGLKPPFIRWPGGSYASEYKWRDGIGPTHTRGMHPNVIWGGYSDYNGFGTDEFLEFCRQLGSEPMIVLAAKNADPAQLEYEMGWVHYLVDPVTTEWGKLRTANGHPEPYKIPYIQIDNEPMNHELTDEGYAAIVNLYGPRIRQIAPQSKIVACGQKRSNDMHWSQTLIRKAGANFDILGCHNYEYEPDNFATGVRRIEDYLEKLCDYVRQSPHPNIKVSVLEWNLCRTQDWRAGLHAAGSLISYEKLSPTLDMTCPALLMRNTTDNPEWRAFIYHDHVSWYPAAGYVAEKLFRDYYAPRRYAITHGTYRDIPRRAEFFDAIPQMKPERWTPNTVDAIATGTADGRRIVIKAVNYAENSHTLLTRIQGAQAPARATVTIKTITAALNAENSLAKPDNIRPVETTMAYTRDMAIPLPAYSVAVVEIKAE